MVNLVTLHKLLTPGKWEGLEDQFWWALYLIQEFVFRDEELILRKDLTAGPPILTYMSTAKAHSQAATGHREGLIHLGPLEIVSHQAISWVVNPGRCKNWFWGHRGIAHDRDIIPSNRKTIAATLYATFSIFLHCNFRWAKETLLAVSSFHMFSLVPHATLKLFT